MEFFSSKDRLPLILSLISIFLISAAALNIISRDLMTTIIFVFVKICIISFFYSIIKNRTAKKKQVWANTKECFYVLSFSGLITAFFAIALPFVLFHNTFVNDYVILLIYLLPLLFVFFISLHLISAALNRKKIIYGKAIKNSFKISIVILIILSAIMHGATVYLYGERSRVYEQAYNDEMTRLVSGMDDLYISDLPIYREISSYQDNIMREKGSEKMAFEDLDAKEGLCIVQDCTKIMTDKVYSIFTLAVNSMIIEGTLSKANKEMYYINSGELGEGFDSLGEYSAYLKNRIDSYDYASITSSSDDEKYISLLAESDFTYADFQNLKYSNAQFKNNINQLSEPFGTDSPLANSLSYTIAHSSTYKEIIRLALRLLSYSGQQNRNNNLLVELYNNIDVEEPHLSKVIRYRIILNTLENIQKNNKNY